MGRGGPAQGGSLRDFDPVKIEPTSAENPALFSSIRVYAVAEKYDIKDLKQLAQSRFSIWASNNWNHSEFPMMVQEVYDSTPSSDRGLRDIVETIVKKNAYCVLHNDEFKKFLINQMGELGVVVFIGALEEVRKLTEEKQLVEKELREIRFVQGADFPLRRQIRYPPVT